MVEFYYFDLDRRSEIGELQESTFEPMQPWSLRLHFFETVSSSKSPAERLRQFVLRAEEEANDSQNAHLRTSPYLGYSIVRGQVGTPIGRSIVTPRAEIWNTKGTEREVLARVVHAQVRTAVAEHVNLFGVPLIAIGVPFLEQDGVLLRCAHVSAWACHYTAVLRGAVARRPTAHFHRSGDWKHAAGRPFPSSGISGMEVVTILNNSDLPPERLAADSLLATRNLNWSDRSALVAALGKGRAPESPVREESSADEASRNDLANVPMVDVAQAIPASPPALVGSGIASSKKDGASPLSDDAAIVLQKKWIRENLSAAVCRYVNSGMPVILTRNDISHTQVVVGYLRESDLATTENIEEGPASTSERTEEPARVWPGVDKADWDDLFAAPAADAAMKHSEVVKFIVSDDLRGPFRLLDVDKIVEKVLTFETEALVPLPEALWMSGETAEQIAARQFQMLATSRAKRVGDWVAAKGSPIPIAEYQKAVEAFAADLSKPGSDKYTIRTYATTGVDLKLGVERRLKGDETFVTTLATIQLPKHVWVAEVIDRARRQDGAENTVRAMMVLDATQVVPLELDDETLRVRVIPLFVHLPGHFFVPGGRGLKQTKGTAPADQQWTAGTFNAYPTGRWDHGRLSALSAARLAYHSKGAVAATRG